MQNPRIEWGERLLAIPETPQYLVEILADIQNLRRQGVDDNRYAVELERLLSMEPDRRSVHLIRAAQMASAAIDPSPEDLGDFDSMLDYYTKPLDAEADIERAVCEQLIPFKGAAALAHDELRLTFMSPGPELVIWQIAMTVAYYYKCVWRKEPPSDAVNYMESALVRVGINIPRTTLASAYQALNDDRRDWHIIRLEIASTNRGAVVIRGAGATTTGRVVVVDVLQNVGARNIEIEGKDN